jgi:hypothetical protein
MRSGLLFLDTDVGGLHHDAEGDNIEDGDDSYKESWSLTRVGIQSPLYLSCRIKQETRHLFC